ncbi:MAG: hypothetical protein Q9227_003129 [Pyrenula ochraceoflavens]
MDSDSEYEYEYDQDTTETFLVDLDVSTVNQDATGFQRQVANPRSRRNPFDTRENEEANDGNSSSEESPGAQQGVSRDEGIIHNGKRGKDVDAPNDIQILGLESGNPIILYKKRLYSGTWTDLIGTNMFFSNHTEDADLEPISSDGEVDLLGISRIKLLAHQARLVPKENAKKRPREEDNAVPDAENGESTTQARPGSGLGALRSVNPKVNMELKKQANFLEKLIEVKRAKGENDLVRTIYEPSREKSRSGQVQGKRNQADLKAEVSRLNKSVLQGDQTALTRLEEIYELLNDAENNSTMADRAPPAHLSQPKT